VEPVSRQDLIDILDGLQARLHRAIRVLVIDDEERARFMVRQFLSGPAFEVSDAADGEEGLLRARADLPDVIILDLVMPGRSGREVLAELRLDPRTRDIPILILTGAYLTEAEKRILRADVSAVLSKADLSRHTLPDVVRTSLGRTV
jgi:CheY-like chemotaxis protein